MMHEQEKSDPSIVATKSANISGRSEMEWMEPREGAKGNTSKTHGCRTQRRESALSRFCELVFSGLQFLQGTLPLGFKPARDGSVLRIHGPGNAAWHAVRCTAHARRRDGTASGLFHDRPRTAR